MPKLRPTRFFGSRLRKLYKPISEEHNYSLLYRKSINQLEKLWKRFRNKDYVTKEMRQQIYSLLNPFVKKSRRLPLDTREYFLEEIIKAADTAHFGKGMVHDPKICSAYFNSLLNLFKPEEKFRIGWKKFHTFPDGAVSRELPVLYVKGFGEIAVLGIYFLPNYNRIDISLFQGVKGTDVRKVSKYLGKPWYEAAMDKLIISLIPLIETGSNIFLAPREDSPVYGKIRDRYFVTSRLGNSLLPLNPRKKRVKELLGELANELSVPKWPSEPRF